MAGALEEETVVGVGAGFFSSYAITSSGAVYGWGMNNYGQLAWPVRALCPLGAPSPTTHKRSPCPLNVHSFIRGVSDWFPRHATKKEPAIPSLR